MVIKEKGHRLPKEYYKGEISVAFTLCLKRDVGKVATGFSLGAPEIVNVFTSILRSVVEKERCIVPAYCFMLDHQHLIITGTGTNVDLWKTVVSYKQKTGFWMSANRPEMRWQKDFYDHILRTKEDIAVHVKYILDNPVKEGLVSFWEEYPFKGSLGCDFGDYLNGLT